MPYDMIHYLWVRAMREHKNRSDASKSNANVLDVLGDL